MVGRTQISGKRGTDRLLRDSLAARSASHSEMHHLATTNAPTFGARLVDDHALRARVQRTAACRPRGLTVTAGWFQNNKDVGGRDTTWEAQQEILRKRRQGGSIESEVSKRRAKVSGFMKGTLSKEETAAIKRKNRDAANELAKEAYKGKPGFISLPGMSIGMPEFDGGERFDLRAPYADEGWVDTENNGISNPFTLGGLFGGKKEADKAPEGKAAKEKPKKKGWFGR